MLKRICLILTVTIFFSAAKAPTNSTTVLKKMYARFHNKWYKTFSFSQTTEIYRNDSIIHTETWFENIKFPGKFRIDFGDPDSANAVIFKDDSSYLFRSSQLVRIDANKDDLLFLLGGLYFYPFDFVIAKMNSYGYDLHKFHEDVWKGLPVYVIGADNNADSVNQLWIEKENYSLIRMLKYENSMKEEALFENHVKLGGGFTETLVHFYVNDKLIQVEKYNELKGDLPIEDAIFDPYKFVKLKL